MKTDTSSFATGGVLEQKHVDDVWYPEAYLSEGMMETECNYEIYDQELLAVVRALEAWCHYLEGLPEKFMIFTNHKNLEYWRTARNLSYRQARWSLFLSWFNFEIVPCPGKTMEKPDVLSRSRQYEVKNEEDNHDQVVLGLNQIKMLAARRRHAQVVANKDLIKQICTCSDKDKEVAKVLEKVQKLGPRLLSKGLDGWNSKDGLILFQEKATFPMTLNFAKSLYGYIMIYRLLNIRGSLKHLNCCRATTGGQG